MPCSRAPAIRESIRLIDVGPERTDALSVSIADAVAIRGLDGEPSQQDASGAWIAWSWTTSPAPPRPDLTSLALHDDQMSLDVVETAERRRAASRRRTTRSASTCPARSQPPAARASRHRPPSPRRQHRCCRTTAWAAPPPSSPRSSRQASRRARPSPPSSSDSDLVEPDDSEPVEPEAQAPVDAADEGEGPVGQAPEDSDPDEDSDARQGASARQRTRQGRRRRGRRLRRSDSLRGIRMTTSHYPPVGTLIAGADVFYPALDQDDAHGCPARARQRAAGRRDFRSRPGIRLPRSAAERGLAGAGAPGGDDRRPLGRQRRSRPRTATAPASRRARISWPIPMSCGRCTTPICSEPIRSIWHREQSKQPPWQSAPTSPPVTLPDPARPSAMSCAD